MPELTTESQKQNRRGPQERGNIRRLRLLKATEELLSTSSLNAITYQEIAARAGLPMGSCYHFYKNKLELIAAFAAQQSERYRETVLKTPIFDGKPDTWLDISDAIIDRTSQYYHDHPAAGEVLIGASAPPDISIVKCEQEGSLSNVLHEIASIIQDIFECYFILPDTPGVYQAFCYYAEIVDRLLSMGYLQNRRISDECAQEIKLAANSYLKNYLPLRLKPKRRHLSEPNQAF